jgi:hypothetical protein
MRYVFRLLIVTAALLAPSAILHAAAPKPLKVFILAGQSNMDGNANVSTIDFLGEDKEHGYLLKKFKPDGKTLVTRDDVWVAHRDIYGKLSFWSARALPRRCWNCSGIEVGFANIFNEARIRWNEPFRNVGPRSASRCHSHC